MATGWHAAMAVKPVWMGRASHRLGNTEPERWLGELAQDLKEKCYRASPVRHVHRLLTTGCTDVVDADLTRYVDTIPRAELMQGVARRVGDRHVLALIEQWLVVPVEEETDRGHRKRTTPAKDTKRGIYLLPLCIGVEDTGTGEAFGCPDRQRRRRFRHLLPRNGRASHGGNAGDDGAAPQAAVNEEKTRCCRVPQEHFDSRLYLRAMRFGEDGTGLHRHATRAEKHPKGLPHGQRGDQPPLAAEHRRGPRSRPEPRTSRMGERLPPRPRSATPTVRWTATRPGGCAGG